MLLDPKTIRRLEQEGRPGYFYPQGAGPQEFEMASGRIGSGSFTGHSGYEIQSGETEYEHNPLLQPHDWRGSDNRRGIVDEMIADDPIVQAVRLNVIFRVVQAGITFVPPEGASEKERKAAEFVNTAFRHHLRSGFRSWHEEAAEAPFRGGRLWEWTQRYDKAIGARVFDEFELRPLWSVDDWLDRGAKGWAVRQCSLSGDTADRSYARPVIEPDQLMHLRFLPNGRNPEPQGLLRPAYGPWRERSLYRKLLAQGAQRAAFGVPVFRVDPTVPGYNEANAAKAAKIGRHWKAGIYEFHMLGPGYTLEVVTFDWRADAIIDARRTAGREIALACLFPQAYTGDGVGAYSLYEGQEGTSGHFLQYTADWIANYLWEGPEAPVKKLVNWNFSGIDRYPEARAGEIRLGDPGAWVETMVKADEGGLLNFQPSDTDQARLYLGLSPAEDVDEPGEPETPEGGDDSEDDAAEARGEPDAGKPGDDPGDDQAGEVAATEGGCGHVHAAEAVSLRVEFDRFTAGPRGREVRPVEESVSFAETVGSNDSAKERQAQIIADWRERVAPEYGRLMQDAATLEAARNVPVPRQRELRDALEANLRGVYRAGLASAANELERTESDPRLMERIRRGRATAGQGGDFQPPEVATAEKYAGINFTPPEGVRKNARRALEVRAKKPPSQRGMTSAGLARARQLAAGRALSPADIRDMYGFLKRHEVDKAGESWDDQGKGWQAWNGWGGDAGLSWSRKVRAQMERADKRETSERPSLLVDMQGLAFQDERGRPSRRPLTAPTPSDGLAESAIDAIVPEEAVLSVVATTVREVAEKVRSAAVAELQARGMGGQMPPAAQVPGIVSRLVEGLSKGVDKTRAQGDVKTIFGLGRSQQQRSEGVQLYMLSNLAESETCELCESVDGTVYGPDRMDDFATPLSFCLGGDRCACLNIALPPEG